MTESEERIVEGSGNVFADLGLRDADELLVCAELSHLIHAEPRDRHLTPATWTSSCGLAPSDNHEPGFGW